MEKKRGRPSKEDSRKFSCYIRLNRSEFEMLEELGEDMDETKSEILRRGLRELYIKNYVKR